MTEIISPEYNELQAAFDRMCTTFYPEFGNTNHIQRINDEKEILKLLSKLKTKMKIANEIPSLINKIKTQINFYSLTYKNGKV